MIIISRKFADFAKRQWFTPSTKRTQFVTWEGSTTEAYTVRLSFGEDPWFDVPGQIRRCDWLKKTLSLEIVTGHTHIQKYTFVGQSQRRIWPGTPKHGISPNDSVN